MMMVMIAIVIVYEGRNGSFMGLKLLARGLLAASSTGWLYATYRHGGGPGSNRNYDKPPEFEGNLFVVASQTQHSL